MRSRTLGPLLALLIVTASCTGGGDREDSRIDPDPPRGGTLRIVEPRQAFGGDAASIFSTSYRALRKDFDPQRAYWETAWELFRCCLLRTLVSYEVGPSGADRVVTRPDLAAEWPTVSPDGLTWTFLLKAGLRYGPPLQDTRIVAADIVRGIARAADPRIVPPQILNYVEYYSVIRGFDAYRNGSADSISGLEPRDDRTLVVHLTRPSGDLPHLMALPATAPIPANPSDPGAPYGTAEGHRTYGGFLVSSGPYMLEGSDRLDFSVPVDQQAPVEGFVPGKSIRLVRNPSWVAATDPLRRAFVDRIVMKIGGTREEALDAIEEGDADLMLETVAEVGDRVQRFQADPDLRDRFLIGSGLSTVYMSMNLALPPFDDIHVRKAVNLAIDKTRMLRLAYEVGGNALDPIGVVASHVAPDPMENDLLHEYDPYPTPGGRGSIRLARTEMMRSRYDSDHDGLCDHPSCRNIRGTSWGLLVGEDAARSAVRDLRTIGLEVDPQVLDFGPFFDRWTDPTRRTPLILGMGWIGDYPNGSTFFVPMFAAAGRGSFDHALLGATTGQLRSWGYRGRRVPSVRERIDQCQSLTGTEQIICWADLDKHLMEQIVPWVPLISGRNAYIFSDRVVRYSYDPLTFGPALDQIALDLGSGS